MSFSDFILACLVLAVAACIVWVMDINPYSKQLQIYSQTCDNMILDNTYCKGDWIDNPVQTYEINLQNNIITYQSEGSSETVVYKTCSIEDSKNWSCTDELNDQAITVEDGLLIYDENTDFQQITRLKWLQNKFLNIIS